MSTDATQEAEPQREVIGLFSVPSSRMALAKRLKSEGHYGVANLYRQEVIRELKEKYPDIEEDTLETKSWEAVSVKYPPMRRAPPAKRKKKEKPKVELSEADKELRALRKLAKRSGQTDMIRDILWVYDNLERPRLKEMDAPSLGAWSLHKWAKQYRNRFFEVLVPRALAAKERSERAKEDEEAECKDMTLEEVERLLKEIRKK